MPDIQENMTQAARDVLAERQRQITEEGWTLGDDDLQIHGQIARAAAAYALNAAGYPATSKDIWPWLDHWWKPGTPRRDLVKAAALIIAEIERLDRAERGDA